MLYRLLILCVLAFVSCTNHETVIFPDYENVYPITRYTANPPIQFTGDRLILEVSFKDAWVPQEEFVGNYLYGGGIKFDSKNFIEIYAKPAYVNGTFEIGYHRVAPWGTDSIIDSYDKICSATSLNTDTMSFAISIVPPEGLTSWRYHGIKCQSIYQKRMYVDTTFMYIPPHIEKPFNQNLKIYSKLIKR